MIYAVIYIHPVEERLHTRFNQLTSGLVCGVSEEGGDLALAVVLRAALGEAGVRTGTGSAQERVARVEVAALAPTSGLVLDAVEERVGDDVTDVRAAAAAAAAAAPCPCAGARPAPGATVFAGLAAVAILAAAEVWLAAAVLRGGRTDSAEER